MPGIYWFRPIGYDERDYELEDLPRLCPECGAEYEDDGQMVCPECREPAPDEHLDDVGE